MSAGTSWPSWSSSCCTSSSLGSSSLDDHDVMCVVVKPPDAAAAAEEDGGGGGSNSTVVKFLCSYGGRILPRHTDGALRYVGGDNRVLSLDRRRLRFHELARRLSEVCGQEVRQVRCQLPAEDLDALVSVTTDADLASLLDVYDDAASHGRLRPLKIRAFLFFPRTTAPEPAAPSPLACSSGPSPSVSSGRTKASSSSPSNAAAHLLRGQNGSWAAAGGAPTTCAAPRWWEQAPPAALVMQRPPHYGRHDQARPPHRWLVHNAAGTGNDEGRGRHGTRDALGAFATTMGIKEKTAGCARGRHVTRQHLTRAPQASWRTCV